MYPHERSLVKRLDGKPFALVGVNSDKDLKALKPILEKEEITWRSFWNGEKGTGGPISAEWKVTGWPTLFLIDHKGVIRRRFLGAPREEGVLDAAIDRLVREAEESEKSEKSGK